MAAAAGVRMLGRLAGAPMPKDGRVWDGALKEVFATALVLS